MRSPLRARAGIRLVALLLAVWPAWLFAGNLEPPDFASAPDTPEISALRTLVQAGHSPEAEHEAGERLKEVPDPEGTGAGETSYLLEVILDAHMAGGGHAAEDLRREADRVLQLRTLAYGRDNLHRLTEILKSRLARGLDTHPAHWGAFVAAGDWR